MWCNFRWTGWTSWWHCLRKEWTIEGGRQLRLDQIDEKRKRRGKAEDWSTHGIVIVLLIFLTCQTNCDICYNMDNNQWYQRNSKMCRVKVGPVCNQFAVNKWREQWQCCRVGRTEKRSKRAFLGSFLLLKHSLYYELPSCMISTFSIQVWCALLDSSWLSPGNSGGRN